MVDGNLCMRRQFGFEIPLFSLQCLSDVFVLGLFGVFSAAVRANDQVVGVPDGVVKRVEPKARSLELVEAVLQMLEGDIVLIAFVIRNRDDAGFEGFPLIAVIVMEFFEELSCQVFAIKAKGCNRMMVSMVQNAESDVNLLFHLNVKY